MCEKDWVAKALLSTYPYCLGRYKKILRSTGLEDLGHNHLATLAVSTIHPDYHVTMQTGESMQRVKLVTLMPRPHTL